MNSRCAAVKSFDGTPQRVFRDAIEPVSTNASDCISFHPTAGLHFAARQRPLRHLVCEPNHCSWTKSLPGVLHRHVVVSMPTAGSARTSPSPSPKVPRWISSSAGASGRFGSHGDVHARAMVAKKQTGEEKGHQRGGGGQSNVSRV